MHFDEDHTVIHGDGAQTRWSYPIGHLGELVHVGADSATYGIENLRYNEDAAERFIVPAGTAGTRDTAEATTDAAAGRGSSDPGLISVDDASVFTVGRYALIEKNEVSEAFLVVGVDTSNNEIRAGHQLAKAFATSASVKGLGWSFAFPAATANDDDEKVVRTPFRVTWTWTGVVGADGAAAAKQQELIFIERSSQHIRCTPLDCYGIDQRLPSMVGEHVRLPGYCRQANTEINAQLKLSRIPPNDMDLAGAGRLAAAYWVAARVYFVHGGERGAEVAEKYEERSTYWLESTIRGLQAVGTVVRERSTDSTTYDAPNRKGRLMARP